MRLDAAGRLHEPLRFPMPRRETDPLSPVEALSPAWHETIRLLFRPFIGKRWISLSLVGLFLGGGTSTAAFQWSFGALPIDLHPTDLLLRLRGVIAQYIILIVLAVVISLAMVLAVIYVRCVMRFVLVKAVIQHEISIPAAWRASRFTGRSYFRWLVGVVGAILLLAFAALFLSFRYLNPLLASGHPSWIASLLLVTELVAVVLVGLTLALAITLTDDLVAPVMWARQVPLPVAWKEVWEISRRDPGAFLFYVVMRFAASMGISIIVLFILFPVLMGLSSGALVAAALVILTLRAFGLAWVWNPLTIFLGIVALSIFTGLLFSLLSVVGMPGQAFLQNYGVRFIASRVPAVEDFCRASSPRGRQG
jgi:hypothetical protein